MKGEVPGNTAWYTSGDGCDVASGDEYFAGYAVHCRASDEFTAALIARCVNFYHLMSASADEAWRLANALEMMRDETNAVVRIDRDGVSGAAIGKAEFPRIDRDLKIRVVGEVLAARNRGDAWPVNPDDILAVLDPSSLQRDGR